MARNDSGVIPPGLRQAIEALTSDSGIIQQFAEFISSLDETLSPTLERFVEEEGELLAREFQFLSRFQPPVTRTLIYARDERGKERSPWKVVDVGYASPEFFPEGAQNLRQALEYMVDQVGADHVVGIWAAPFQIEDQMGFLLYMRDQDGVESMHATMRGEIRNMGMPSAVIPKMLASLIDPHRSRGERPFDQLEQKLLKPDNFEDMKRALKEMKVRAISEAQWAGVMKWVAHSDVVRHRMYSYARAHTNNWAEEAHALLRLVTHTVTEFFEKSKADADKKMAEIEKNHDKKLKRLRSDLEKMMLLSEGVKKRAERADADNRLLRKQLKDAQALQTGSQQVVAVGSSDSAAQSDDSLGMALDALFD